MDLPTHLRARRSLSRVSLRETARRCDLSATYLMRLERGHYDAPHPNTLRQIARGYDTSYRLLLELAGYTE